MIVFFFLSVKSDKKVNGQLQNMYKLVPSTQSQVSKNSIIFYISFLFCTVNFFASLLQ